jgi:hypothetical protein
MPSGDGASAILPTMQSQPDKKKAEANEHELSHDCHSISSIQ